MPFKKGAIPINFKDLTGKRYGKLLVISKAEKRHDKTFWVCQCDCGKIKEIYGGSLTKTKDPTRSCNCLSTEFNRKESTRKIRSKSRLPDNEGGLNDLIRQYKDNVKNRKLSPIKFLLTKEEFKTFNKQNCYYCDIEPSADRWGYKYNGIDRVDSSGDYVYNNCVSCCFMCNLMKNRYSTEQFFNQIELIYNKHLKDKK